MCTCNQKSKVSGMAKKRKTYRRRRRARVNGPGENVMGALKSGALAGAGFVVGKMLVNKVGFLQSNPGFAVAAQLAGAVILPMAVKGPIGATMGVGMAVGAVTEAVKMASPDLSSQLGLGFPSTDFRNSTRLPGVAATPTVWVD